MEQEKLKKKIVILTIRGAFSGLVAFFKFDIRILVGENTY